MIKLKTILQCKKIYIIFLLLSIVWAFVNPLKNINNLNENTRIFTGIIKDFSIKGDKLDLTVKISSSDKIKATYYISNKEELESVKKNIRIGIKLSMYGTLSNPTNNTIPGTFNYKKYLENKNIFYILMIDKYEIIQNENIFYKIKNLVSYRTYKNNKTKAYLKAFVLGNDDEIDNEVLKSYRTNGITHLFAISGMHIGLLTIILNKILDKFKIKEIIKLLITILFIIFYGFITSFSASFLRAGLFFVLVSIFKNFKINIETKYIFFLTVSILLFYNPKIIKDIGFEYSVMTSLGIIIASKYLKTKNKIISLLKVSIIAFLFSFPITLFYFYEINILGIVNNLFFVPVISSILFPLCLIAYFIPIVNQLLFIVIPIIEKISLFLAKYFVLSFNIPLNIFSLILIYFILFLAFNKKLKYLIFLIFIAIIIKIKPYFDSSTYIFYLDVGQGDSSLIITPYQKDIILIDTGGKISYQKEEWAQRENVSLSDNIINFLKSKGISRIGYLITTHGDFDHMGESINLVNNFKVDNVIFNCGEYNDLEKKLISVLEKKNIRYSSCVNELNIDKYKLQFLNTKEYDNENDNSSVIYFNYNNYKFLFMGDAGIEREKDILEEYNIPNIDFLKVGHHGSNTSSGEKFINTINPKYSLISVGKNNRYDHPKESVMDILNNSKIYRTDLDGSVEIKLNRDGYKIRNCPP